MPLYSIQRISDGKFLLNSSRGFRAQTHQEFESYSSKAIPRLFTKETGAIACMKLWIRGKWITKTSGGIKLFEARNVDPNDYRVVEVEIKLSKTITKQEQEEIRRKENSVL
jgi:hypothetical protein